MATTLASFDAGHADMVHDVQLDYYGRRLATASSDRSIKVFDVVGEQVGLSVKPAGPATAHLGSTRNTR